MRFGPADSKKLTNQSVKVNKYRRWDGKTKKRPKRRENWSKKKKSCEIICLSFDLKNPHEVIAEVTTMTNTCIDSTALRLQHKDGYGSVKKTINHPTPPAPHLIPFHRNKRTGWPRYSTPSLPIHFLPRLLVPLFISTAFYPKPCEHNSYNRILIVVPLTCCLLG